MVQVHSRGKILIWAGSEIKASYNQHSGTGTWFFFSSLWKHQTALSSSSLHQILSVSSMWAGHIHNNCLTKGLSERKAMVHLICLYIYMYMLALCKVAISNYTMPTQLKLLAVSPVLCLKPQKFAGYIRNRSGALEKTFWPLLLLHIALPGLLWRTYYCRYLPGFATFQQYCSQYNLGINIHSFKCDGISILSL